MSLDGLLGNDVVDLGDPESHIESRHPRWDERVFGPAERAALERSPQRQRLHWALWAAKESAYKARKRRCPETVFSPREFAVALPLLARQGGRSAAVGEVVYQRERFALEVHIDGASVHAVARSEDQESVPLLWRVARSHGDPGAAARRVAAAALGSALGLDPARIRIVDRPPVAVYRDRGLDVRLSLSHHGRFVAFACSLPDATAKII